jgi:hypothetical protein
VDAIARLRSAGPRANARRCDACLTYRIACRNVTVQSYTKGGTRCWEVFIPPFGGLATEYVASECLLRNCELEQSVPVYIICNFAIVKCSCMAHRVQISYQDHAARRVRKLIHGWTSVMTTSSTANLGQQLVILTLPVWSICAGTHAI